jgi:hypothetical protein
MTDLRARAISGLSLLMAIIALGLAAYNSWSVRAPLRVEHRHPATAYLAPPLPVATEADKRAAEACTKKYGGGPVNPLYVQKFGRCPEFPKPQL